MSFVGRFPRSEKDGIDAFEYEGFHNLLYVYYNMLPLVTIYLYVYINVARLQGFLLEGELLKSFKSFSDYCRRPEASMQELSLWYGTLSKGLQGLDFGSWAAITNTGVILTILHVSRVEAFANR